MTFFLQLVVSGLVIGSIYALVALGFVMIYKSSGVINFAQGEFLLVGAYVSLTLFTDCKLPFLLAVFIALLSCVLLGLVVERLVLRPFIGKSVISVIMATIGLSSLMRGVIQVIWGTDTRTFPDIFPVEPINMGGVVVTEIYLWSLGLALGLLGLFSLFFKFSSTGIAMRAAADDQNAALSIGISVKRVVAVTWAIAAVVAAIAGILLANINGVNSSLAAIGLKVLPVAVLGGLDSLPGAIIGGFAIGLIESLAGGYLDPVFGGGVKDVVPFIVLVMVLMFRPYGLFGKEITERV